MLLLQYCYMLRGGTPVNLFYWNFLPFKVKIQINLKTINKLMTFALIMALAHLRFCLLA